MPASIEEVQRELVEHFGERITGSRFFADYAAIGSYLSDPGKYMPALQQLHIAMDGRLDHNLSQFFRGAFDRARRDGLKRALVTVYADLERGRAQQTQLGTTLEAMSAQVFHKILTDALKENEITHGFRVGNVNNRAAIILGNAGAAFNTLLKDKQPFKDLGAGREHGENSHRIQWYLISKMAGLVNGVTDIYSKLPGWKTSYRTQRYFYMWEFLVDRDGVPTNAAIIPFKTADQSDFRAPSNVNHWLKDGRTAGLELLQACLTNRFNRRQGVVMDEYMAKKLGSDFASLSPPRQREFSEFVLGSNAVLNR